MRAAALALALLMAPAVQAQQVCLMQDDVCEATEAALADIGAEAGQAEIEAKLSPILLVHFARVRSGACVEPAEVEAETTESIAGTLGPQDVTLTKMTTASGGLYCTFAQLAQAEQRTE